MPIQGWSSFAACTRRLVGAVALVVPIAVLAVFGAAAATAGDAISPAARAALATVIPQGYQAAAVVPCELEAGGKGRFVAALVDEAAQADTNGSAPWPERNVRLLYLVWAKGRWTVLDSMDVSAKDPTLAPQFADAVSVVTVGTANLLFVRTAWSAGGSGSWHYFLFITAVDGHLRLVRRFEHERMQRGLLTLRDERLYDANVACSRGEKKGKAYVYSCYLDTREFTYDGEHLTEVRRERLEERSGNRFLDETYWNISLRSVLQKGGHFLALP